VGTGASASPGPVIVGGEMRVSTILGPMATTTRTTADLSAPRSPGWPIVMAGYIPRTMPRPPTVS
jgi:hypothetical protein